MTSRLAASIAREALSRPFATIAKTAGVADRTVRSVFAGHIADMEAKHHFEPPAILAVDHVVVTQPRLLVTSPTQGTILDLLPEVSPIALVSHLDSLPQERLKAVCVPMGPLAEEVAQRADSGAGIVIPWRHLVSIADRCLETVRKTTRKEAPGRYDQKKLQGDKVLLAKPRENLTPWERSMLADWHDRFPLLAQAYEAREDLAAIAGVASSHQAETEYHAWAAGLSPELQAAFTEVLAAVDTWREPLFACFDLSAPNPARWELPARIEELHRIGRGYSFDVLRAKVLFTPELHKLGTVDGAVVNFGVNISSFTEAVQNGNLWWKKKRKA